ANAGQEVVGLERRLRGERVDELQAGCRAKGHGDRARTIQLHNRRRHKVGESVVQLGDASPIFFRGSTRASVTRGDGGLVRIRAKPASEPFGALEGGETTTD